MIGLARNPAPPRALKSPDHSRSSRGSRPERNSAVAVFTQAHFDLALT